MLFDLCLLAVKEKLKSIPMHVYILSFSLLFTFSWKMENKIHLVHLIDWCLSYYEGLDGV